MYLRCLTLIRNASLGYPFSSSWYKSFSANVSDFSTYFTAKSLKL